MKKVKVIKLDNGEDIVCSFPKEQLEEKKTSKSREKLAKTFGKHLFPVRSLPDIEHRVC